VLHVFVSTTVKIMLTVCILILKSESDIV